MDDFAEKIRAVLKEDADVPAVLFADDVILLAMSPTALQRLLDIATIWATENGMTWNTKKRKERSTRKRRDECPHLCTCREAPLPGFRSHLPRYLSRATRNHERQQDQTPKKCQDGGPSTEIAGSICQRNTYFKFIRIYKALIQPR